MSAAARTVSSCAELLAPSAAAASGGSAARRFDPPLKCRLLIMQPTPFCNISCDYCYLADRNDSRRMADEVVAAAAQRLVESTLLDRSLGIVWHAGEPLAAGLKFYELSFESLARSLGTHTELTHSIQTNGTLIDRRWCELFERWHVRVGISLDGPADLHDKHRKTRQGGPTFAKVMRGIDHLRQADIPFHVIAVLTSDSLHRADEIFDFFAREGIYEVGFNIDEQEGAHGDSSVDRHGSQHERFLRRMLERSLLDPARLNVRELEVSARLVLQPLPNVTVDGDRYPDNSQVLPGAILSVAANGDFSTFSPELIDQRHPTLGPLVFGNVLRDSFDAMFDNERFKAVYIEMLSGVKHCRESCQFFAFCGGGAPANKLAEHGAFNGTETAYCRATLKRPLGIVLEKFEQVSARLGATARPSDLAPTIA